MRLDCVCACIEFGAKQMTFVERQMDEQTDGTEEPRNTLVDQWSFEPE